MYRLIIAEKPSVVQSIATSHSSFVIIASWLACFSNRVTVLPKQKPFYSV